MAAPWQQETLQTLQWVEPGKGSCVFPMAANFYIDVHSQYLEKVPAYFVVSEALLTLSHFMIVYTWSLYLKDYLPTKYKEFSEVCEYRKNIKIEDLPCLHSADLQTGGRMWRHKARRLSGPDSSHAALCSLQPPLWTPALHCGKVWADLDTAESCSTLQHCRTCLLVFSLPAIHTNHRPTGHV